ncbi:carbohydrate sulfotransferase 13-like [Patiria miniata]|uniref:Carbohydrate sulfotransferase n=1 Tax=Patiria miniata TaxID=46514 RepID=A0A914BR01_PATMI|nr:carbohydrate sulfotransferase 13-like [Patiria miniata]
MIPMARQQQNVVNIGSQSDVGKMTSRSRLSVLILMLVLTLLSILAYLQSPLQIGLTKNIVVGNFPPRQRHLNDIARTTLPQDMLGNSTDEDVSRTIFNIDKDKTARPTEDLMVKKSEEQRTRKSVLHEACKHYDKQTNWYSQMRIPPNIIVDDAHKVVYCSVPKVACTSWKKVFLVLNKSFKNTSEISQYFANRDGQKMLIRLKDLPDADINRILKSYTKFLFARHPFSRVLSAFRNKLDPESTFERAEIWQRTVGKRILDEYRESRKAGAPFDLTFEEFIRYLTDPEVPRKKSSNKHWSRIYDQCLPCDIDYDVIGKFETLNEDSEYILRLIHADDVIFPGSDSSSPTGSSNQTRLESYYKGVPLVDLQNLYQRFKIDFDIFGYEPPTLAFKGS